MFFFVCLQSQVFGISHKTLSKINVSKTSHSKISFVKNEYTLITKFKLIIVLLFATLSQCIRTLAGRNR